MKKLMLALALVIASAAAGAAPGPPNPAPSLVVTPNTSVTITWSPVTQYTNSTDIPQAQRSNQGYKLYSTNSVPTNGVYGFIGYVGSPTVFSTTRVQTAVGTNCYALTTVVYNPNARESAYSMPICVQTVSSTPPPPLTPASPTPVCVAPAMAATVTPAIHLAIDDRAMSGGTTTETTVSPPTPASPAGK